MRARNCIHASTREFGLGSIMSQEHTPTLGESDRLSTLSDLWHAARYRRDVQTIAPHSYAEIAINISGITDNDNQ